MTTVLKDNKKKKTIKLCVKEYKDAYTLLLKMSHKDGKSFFLISNMFPNKYSVPRQAKIVPMRVVLLYGVKRAIFCPHAWNLMPGDVSPEDKLNVGDLILI